MQAKVREMILLCEENNIPLDEAKLNKVLSFAVAAHFGQKRLSGEDYIWHGYEVGKILIHWRLDTDSIIAGILHDSVDDGAASYEDLKEVFGEGIAELVMGVTTLGRIRLRGSRNNEFVENLRKMFLAMSQDLRVVLIKLADRLHNMRTLSSLAPCKQKKIAQETLEIFAPLAERLGMGEVKSELEDLAFPYVYPEKYEEVIKLSRSQYKEASQHIFKMRRTILRALAKEAVAGAKLYARKKHLYSLWRKLERKDIKGDFSQIHDIVAMRILVSSIKDCYVALGVVHSHYKPVPHLGISDFIAQPKPNGYRSIHTKVFGPKNRIVEVQIRTFTMHEEAEYGVAAHWAYSEAKSRGKVTSNELEAGISVGEDKLNWVKQLATWQEEIVDSKEFLAAVKFDALSDHNFVFSPKGDVFDLPVDATPVDFAFCVHTKLGNYIQGAKVDGKVVPLSCKLKSGQVVEIIKAKNPKKPNRDWLRFVKTQTARRIIQKAIREETD